jgi:hypothetical protein
VYAAVHAIYCEGIWRLRVEVCDHTDGLMAIANENNPRSGSAKNLHHMLLALDDWYACCQDAKGQLVLENSTILRDPSTLIRHVCKSVTPSVQKYKYF